MRSLASVLLLAVAVSGLAGCNDSSDRDMQKTDTLNSQHVDKNPQIDRDPTPETGTGGDQQPSAPAPR